MLVTFRGRVFTIREERYKNRTEEVQKEPCRVRLKFSRMRQEKYKTILEHFMVPQSKEVLKK